MADTPITELVLSPRWTVSVGDIDGTAHVVLRIHHPRLGPLDFLLPNNHAVEFAAALEKTWERRDEAPMRRTAPPGPPRQAHSYWWSWLIRSEPVVTSKFVATDAAAARDKRSKGSD